jgi:D-methionine transport system substrate-binding protein
MKKLIPALLLAAASITAFAAEKITIGVTPFPHEDIMKVAKPLLAKEGYDLEIKEFNDYVQPNMALAEKQIDANFFQHIPYLENMDKEKGLNLVWVAKVHVEPLGLYSKKIKSISELKAGDLIAVPNDPSNEARALRLLEKGGLIQLKAGDGELATVRDIAANPKKLKFREIDAAQLPRTLDDVAASVINANFAGEAGLVPSRDAILSEGKDSPYANVIVVRAEDKDQPFVKALVKAVHSPEVRAYIEKVLAPKGIVPAF